MFVYIQVRSRFLNYSTGSTDYFIQIAQICQYPDANCIRIAKTQAFKSCLWLQHLRLNHEKSPVVFFSSSFFSHDELGLYKKSWLAGFLDLTAHCENTPAEVLQHKLDCCSWDYGSQRKLQSTSWWADYIKIKAVCTGIPPLMFLPPTMWYLILHLLSVWTAEE